MKIKERFSKQVLYITLFFSFVFPITVFAEKDFFLVNKMVYNALLMGLYGVYVLRLRLKITPIDIMIVMFMILRVVFTKDFESLGLVYLLIIRHLEFNGARVSRKYLVLILLSILFYSVVHHWTLGLSMISSSIGERNEVGFYLVVLYFVLRIHGMKTAAVIILLSGLLTYSRNYFVSFCLVFFADYLGPLWRRRQKPKFPKFLNFRRISIGSIVFVLLLFVYFNNASVEYVASTGFERLFRLKDTSNYHRFVANIYPLYYYVQNPSKLLFGVDYSTYRDFIATSGITARFRVGKINAPHNYFFKTLYKYGGFSIFIFYYVGVFINRRLTRSNLYVLLVYFTYAMFLGTGFYENGLILLLFILSSMYSKKTDVPLDSSLDKT